MSDTIFDSFIASVYGGGSAVELFDNSIDIIGGIDDITVETMFGGTVDDPDVYDEQPYSSPDDNVLESEVVSEEPIDGGLFEIDGGTSIPLEVDKSEGGLVSEVKFTFDKPVVAYDDKLLSSNVAPIAFKVNLDRERNADTKKGAGTIDASLDAKDVASLISEYMSI